jgi:hypothetical protein
VGLPNTGFIGFVVDRVGSVGLLHELIAITEINAHTIARLMIDSNLTSAGQPRAISVAQGFSPAVQLCISKEFS